MYFAFHFYFFINIEEARDDVTVLLLFIVSPVMLIQPVNQQT